jgi:hypothetical protein
MQNQSNTSTNCIGNYKDARFTTVITDVNKEKEILQNEIAMILASKGYGMIKLEIVKL